MKYLPTEGGNYSRAETIHGNTVVTSNGREVFLNKLARSFITEVRVV